MSYNFEIEHIEPLELETSSESNENIIDNFAKDAKQHNNQFTPIYSSRCTYKNNEIDKESMHSKAVHGELYNSLHKIKCRPVIEKTKGFGSLRYQRFQDQVNIKEKQTWKWYFNKKMDSYV